jgi:hypothetical protein
MVIVWLMAGKHVQSFANTSLHLVELELHRTLADIILSACAPTVPQEAVSPVSPTAYIKLGHYSIRISLA